LLINALYNYYNILLKAGDGRVIQDGYSKVKVHYLVHLTDKGEINGITNWQDKKNKETKNGKLKEVWVPKEITMPERTQKTSIDANIIEHRPLYLFGLNQTGEGLSAKDDTRKAEKSHKVFAEANLEFLEGLDSPVINAYRQFILNWKPEEETENIYLLGLGKNYSKSNFAFCLADDVQKMLHEDSQINKKWEMKMAESLSKDNKEQYTAQCAITGETGPVSRIHNKIKGVYGGSSTGSVLVSYKNSSESSYGNEQSYNSNISETAMKKYTEALNYLLNSPLHKALVDDITVLFWAMDAGEKCERDFLATIIEKPADMDANAADDMLKRLMKDARKGKISENRLLSSGVIAPDTDFYIAGLKPNTSRIALKFIYKRKYADILWNIANHQNDMQITGMKYPVVSIASIQKELVPPKDKDKTANPGLVTKLFEAVFNGTCYPVSLLETVVRRVKTDADDKTKKIKKINSVRAGIIKACINRKLRFSNKKEELKVALDKENTNPAYLCGRLFAALEKLQQAASENPLNRTIKDAYFSSAASTPATVFPNLLKLAQNHLNKARNLKGEKVVNYYKGLIQEIIWNIQGGFPRTLTLEEQGKFMVGYYHQYQSSFEVSGKSKDSKNTDGVDAGNKDKDTSSLDTDNGMEVTKNGN